ncbi:MAG: hypothetical protein AAB733_02635 [Patescibacteria group bacterium]
MTIPTVEDYRPREELKEIYLPHLQTNKDWYPKGVKAYLLLLFPQTIASMDGVSAVNTTGYQFGVATYMDQDMRWSYDPRDFAEIGKVLISNNQKDDA